MVQEFEKDPTIRVRAFYERMLGNFPLMGFITLLLGASFSFAFAPYHLSPLAFICPALLLLLWNCSQNTKHAFSLGWLFGVGLFAAGTPWIYTSIHDYGNTIAPVAFIFTLIFTLIMGSFYGLNGYLLKRFFPQPSFWHSAIAFPAIWVLMEWIRGWFLSGFPWLFIGYTQLNTPLSQFVPMIGIYGVSFLTLFCIGSFHFIVKNLNQRSIVPILLLMAIGTTTVMLKVVRWTHPVGHSLSVSLIQGNISQNMKWDINQAQNVMKTYETLTRKTINHDVVIWSESAIPLPINILPNYLNTIANMAKQFHASVIIGAPQMVKRNDQYYNGIFVLGEGQGTYYKRHLVPFGEYLPFDKWLRGLINFFDIPMSSYIPGPKKQAPLTIKNVSFAPFLCYEIAYPELVLEAIKNSQILIALSDDSWFGHSNAASQQLQMGQMRALETGHYFISATNDGISAIVNSRGKITQIAPSHQQTILDGSVKVMSGITPLTRIGHKPILGFILLLLCWAWQRSRHQIL